MSNVSIEDHFGFTPHGGTWRVIKLQGCPYSQGAVDLLRAQHEKGEIVVIDSSSQKERAKQWMSEHRLASTTFPQIWKKTEKGSWKYVGGYTELKRLLG